MKKFLSFMMALVMVLSLGIPAVGATDPTGSITIDNPTIGKKYEIYKVFDVTTTTSGINYRISDENQFHDEMFGDDGTGGSASDKLDHNHVNGYVALKSGVDDSALLAYLTNLVTTGSFTADASKVATVDVKDGGGAVVTPGTLNAAGELVFDDLPYGYYLITSELGAVVTISSVAADVTLIDKNQKPAVEIQKQIKTGESGGVATWGDSNSANIGDKVTYKLSLTATNYDGINQILYYQVHDSKGDSIWAEFDSFRVFVHGEELTRGYYLSQGGVNTGGWEFLGPDGDDDGTPDGWETIDEAERDANDAQWYLVHLGYDEYRITIPWLSNHAVAPNTDGAGNVLPGYKLTCSGDALYESPSEIEIFYDAAVEANAAIGTTSHGNRFNKAYASWTSAHETGRTTEDEVVTYVYGVGLLKDDGSSKENLYGAKFRLYKDEARTQPVYLIPTDIDGVYIVDSKGAYIETVTGTGREITRGEYAAADDAEGQARLAAYLADAIAEAKAAATTAGKTQDEIDAITVNTVQDNYAVSQVNGKLAILGLEAGTYYLYEVEAPAGYNPLNTAVVLEAGKDTRPFVIFANDANGKVADIQSEDGVHTEHTYHVTHTVVSNYTGTQLPSTGGEGTARMIAIGSAVAIAFAVLLITHKKMSVYHD